MQKNEQKLVWKYRLQNSGQFILAPTLCSKICELIHWGRFFKNVWCTSALMDMELFHFIYICLDIESIPKP